MNEQDLAEVREKTEHLLKVIKLNDLSVVEMAGVNAYLVTTILQYNVMGRTVTKADWMNLVSEAVSHVKGLTRKMPNSKKRRN